MVDKVDPDHRYRTIGPNANSAIEEVIRYLNVGTILMKIFVPDAKYARTAVTSSYGVDSNCYTDTGATDHVTGKLEKLTVHDRYRENA
jgi:hypothetical protein